MFRFAVTRRVAQKCRVLRAKLQSEMKSTPSCSLRLGEKLVGDHSLEDFIIWSSLDRMFKFVGSENF